MHITEHLKLLHTGCVFGGEEWGQGSEACKYSRLLHQAKIHTQIHNQTCSKIMIKLSDSKTDSKLFTLQKCQP
jgi:hypothetical protein